MDNHKASLGIELARIRRALSQRFSLLEDKADDAEIESRIRDGSEFRGATPWILIFAIFIASVGLNVNSTAVIIGAMLISPIMGPIMGTGLGVAVYDFELVKRSLKNLGIATLISLVVSAAYFMLTPLQQARSELLARTSPTLWDVLIALFGGLAGIIGVTRRERSNVIPGVAIATALMPPVCTAGFGLATGQWRFVGGALYLYIINCVFIALATVVGIRALKLKRHSFADQALAKRVKAILLALALGTTLPSIFLALNLVRHEVFRFKAQAFVVREFAFENTHVAATKVDPETRVITLSLIGDPLKADTLHTIQERLSTVGLAGARLVLHQMGDNHVDVTALKSSLLSDLLRDSQGVVKEKANQIQELQDQVQALKLELASRNASLGIANEVANELKRLYPDVTSIVVADGVEIAPSGKNNKLMYFNILSRRGLSKDARHRIESWLKVRMKTDKAMFHFDVGITSSGKNLHDHGR